ncbi:MAG TPA: hypothetical protein VHX65_09105 [Pirellulales bacterium]|jgi:hypothetical protein|nr:hypothetical protein [Pirellulales bacterium]
MAVATPFSWLLVMLLGGGAGVPLAVPPLPEDPVMAHVAPADCVWYFTASGVAEPDPKSRNQTEQLAAEPEVRNFVRDVGRALAAAIRKGAPPTPQGKLLGAEGPGLLHMLLTRPVAAFISKAEVGPLGPAVAGGIVVGTGDDTAQVEATLEKLEQMLLGPNANGGATAVAQAPASVKWNKLPTPPGVPTVEWGFRGKYLIVGIGDGSADAISTRLSGPTPDWLVALKKKLPVERIGTVHYLNVKKVLATAAPFLGLQGQAALHAAGVDQVAGFANVSGLDGTGCVSKSWLQFDGEPRGLLTWFGSVPLTAADLVPIPKDASFAIAARVPPAEVWKTILSGISTIDAGAGAQMADGVKQMESALGFRVQEDFLQTLGDSWCVYNSPGEGGLIITGLTMVASVKDHDRLVKTNEQFVEFVRKNPVGASSGAAIEETTFQKQKIYYLNVPGGEIPFAPAWCITDKQWIISLSPQNIRAYLSRDPAAGSLADIPVVAEKLKAASPVLITYQDTAATLKITYPVLQIFATIAASHMQQEGLDVNASMLPSLASLLRHVEPGISTLSREKNGFLYVSRQSLPLDPTMSGMLPLWVGAFTFARADSVRPAPPTIIESAEPARR